MKIGMNMLLWTGHITEVHVPVLKALKDTGFDGVEIPIFDPSDVSHFRWLAGVLDDLGLERTSVALIPDEAHSPLSPDAAARQAGVDHLNRVIDCAAALGAQALVGPWFQPLGVFSGEGPTEAELERCAGVHRAVAQKARDAGLICALEPLNRFECYLLNTCEQSSAYLERLGEPGFGILYDTFHANIEEKDPLAALHAAYAKALDYQGWLTIEAFGKALPELAAATRVWRDFFANPEEVYTEGYQYIRTCWDAA
jgi:D-psicose/D-tagatose/L-ribulose 3-epimerase